MNKTNTPLVSIRCITYNHEKYIRDALEGFVMQKTNFKFEAIVHDDASTDNTAAIIQEYAEKYPDIIKPIFETENQYSKKDGSLRRIMNEAVHPNAKYIAFCEGDDFWTDPYKLQKQFEIMENNPNCSLCYHACKNIFENVNPSSFRFGESVKESYKLSDMLNYHFQTATVMIKKEVLFCDLYNKALSTGCASGDVMIFLTAASLGNLIGINKQMSVYRRHLNGISNTIRSKEYLYKNYVSWIKVGKVFKGDIQKHLIKYELKSYIAKSIVEYKDLRLFSKMVYHGMINCPLSVFFAIKNITKTYIKRYF